MTRFDHELAHWKRQMRRFFLGELPAALLIAAITYLGYRSIPDTAPSQIEFLALGCVVAATALVLWVWSTRLPPERPAPYETEKRAAARETASD